MVRLVIYLVLFGAGLWTGMKFERVALITACLDAGGSVDPRGFCTGARP